MAAIRFPVGGGRYRYYGSPKQEPAPVVRSPNRGSKYMRVLWLHLIGLALTVWNAVVTTPFIYVGWNWGMCDGVRLFVKPLSVLGAFCLSLLLCGCIGVARTSLTMGFGVGAEPLEEEPGDEEEQAAEPQAAE